MDSNSKPDIIFNPDLFSETFWKLKEAKKRYVNVRGGANSSKSYSVYQLIVIWLMTEMNDILCIRKISADLENSIYDGIKNIIKQWGLIDRFQFAYSGSKREIRFKQTGSRALFKGMNDPEQLKSIVNIKRVIAEEASELDETDFEELDRRARGMEGVQIFLLYNPISYENWIYKKFFENDKLKEDTDYFQFTYFNNKNKKGKWFLTEKDKEKLEKYKEYSEYEYKVYCLGEFGKISKGGEYYFHFNYAKHVKRCEFNPELPLHPSFDQNVSPYITSIISQIEFKEDIYYVRISNEICLSNPRNTMEALANEIEYQYGDELNGLIYYGDASGRKRDTRGIEDDYDILERVLRKYITNSSCRVPYSNPGHNKRRKFLNKIFFGGIYPIVIEIDPRCTNLIKDLEKVIIDIDGGKVKKVVTDKLTGQKGEELGHCSDALDYLICSAFERFFNAE